MLTFQEYLTEKYGPAGTYSALKFAPGSATSIASYQMYNAIPKPVPVDKLHVTLLYSRKTMTGFEARGQLMDPIPVYVKSFDVWPSKDGARVLVAQLNAPDVETRHRFLMDTYKGTYDFPDYKPHFTMSYNVPEEFNAGNLPVFDRPLYLDYEYGKDLDTDWKPE